MQDTRRHELADWKNQREMTWLNRDKSAKKEKVSPAERKARNRKTLARRRVEEAMSKRDRDDIDLGF